MEHIGCPICRSDDAKFLFDRLDHTHYVTQDRFSLVRCRRCKMVYVNPRPDAIEIESFYPADFYDTGITAERLLEEKQGALEARARLLSPLRPGRLLDIGCQKGEFLFWMQRKGWEVQGIEFSKTPPNMFGMPIQYGRIECAALQPKSFNAITLWAVLEHVHDPVAALGQVSNLLAPGGRAFALVPNFRSLPARVMRHDDVPRHLMMFTPATLRRAAELVGLRVRRFLFSGDIFSDSTRGLFNFVVKRAFGESYDEILRQNRSVALWSYFTGFLNGKPSSIVRMTDRADQRLTPYVDRIARKLRCGFTMTAELEPVRRSGAGF